MISGTEILVSKLLALLRHSKDNHYQITTQRLTTHHPGGSTNVETKCISVTFPFSSLRKLPSAPQGAPKRQQAGLQADEAGGEPLQHVSCHLRLLVSRFGLLGRLSCRQGKLLCLFGIRHRLSEDLDAG